MAAQEHRVALFEAEGWALWDNAWYAGHHLWGYSLLFPPLGALLGTREAGLLAVVAGAAVLAALLRGGFGDGPRVRWAVLWGALGLTSLLWTGRLTFALGTTIALGALLAAQRGRPGLAVLLAALSAVASPVAGAFLALAMGAWFLAPARASSDPPMGWVRRRSTLVPATIAAAGVLPTLLISVAFPSGGDFPFTLPSLLPTLAGAVLLAAVLPSEHRALRIGAALYALVVLLSGVVPSPMGGNAARLGALFAGPLAVAALPARSRWLLLVVPAFLYWQWAAPVDDVVRARDDPSTKAAFYAPLVEQLRARGAQRVEVPFTDGHYESRHLAKDVALARGWERQLDREVNALFYEDGLTPARYERWLRDVAVDHVALPDAPIDYSAADEAALVRTVPPFLREVWRGDGWRLFAVVRPTPIARGARLVSMDADEVVLDVRAGRPVDLRVRWTPYWVVAAGAGCVRKAGAWTAVAPSRSGRLRLATRFAPGRVRSTAPRCTDSAS